MKVGGQLEISTGFSLVQRAFYVGCLGLKSRRGDRSSWLRFFTIFLIPFRQIPCEYLKLDCIHFPPHAFEFIIHNSSDHWTLYNLRHRYYRKMNHKWRSELRSRRYVLDGDKKTRAIGHDVAARKVILELSGNSNIGLMARNQLISLT